MTKQGHYGGRKEKRGEDGGKEKRGKEGGGGCGGGTTGYFFRVILTAPCD